MKDKSGSEGGNIVKTRLMRSKRLVYQSENIRDSRFRTIMIVSSWSPSLSNALVLLGRTGDSIRYFFKSDKIGRHYNRIKKHCLKTLLIVLVVEHVKDVEVVF